MPILIKWLSPFITKNPPVIMRPIRNRMPNVAVIFMETPLLLEAERNLKVTSPLPGIASWALAM
jgi:hypothetical protein